MAGSGDMLVACLNAGATPQRLRGVEIDRQAFAKCRSNLGAMPTGQQASIVHGNAFDPANWRDLGIGYDLAITNPPYVRYQSTAGVHAHLPDATLVRAGLLQIIANAQCLDERDRDELTSLVQAYSGLSDLLLPSWFLAVAMLRPGGTIAMVLPESFLSRDYAAVAWYSLLRWFDLQFLIQDVDSAWFDDAQVNTVLLVAKRVQRREHPLNPPADDGHLVVRLRDKAADGRSVVGALFSGSSDPDQSFVELASELLLSRGEDKTELFEAHWVPRLEIAGRVAATSHGSSWLPTPPNTLGAPVVVPSRVTRLIAHSTADSSGFCCLADLGWSVGQGLRTGANDFFYLELIEDRGETQVVRTSSLFGQRILEVPERFLLPALRRQTDLPADCHNVRGSDTCGRLLFIDGYALSEDMQTAPKPNLWFRELSGELADHIRLAARTEVQGKTSTRLLREGSAVVTNVRPWSSSKERVAPRFWYMLPELKDRHRPSILMARVQGGTGSAYINEGRTCIVDANFCTLWPSVRQSLGEDALLALLNSTWVALNLELSAAVMGGGALKVEATHVKRLPLPRVPKDRAEALGRLGEKLRKRNVGRRTAVVHEIDREVATLIVGTGRAELVSTQLRELLASMRHQRSGRP